MKGSKREIRPGVWELRVHAGTDLVTGKPRYVSRTVHGGPRLVSREMARLVAEVSAKRVVGTNVTFGSLLDTWLGHLEALGRSPTTIKGYRSKVESAIKPALGDVSLDRLGPADLDRFYRSRVQYGNSPRTIAGMHRVISSVLSQAVRWGWADSNVALRATPPSAPMREIPVPSPSELQLLVERAGLGRQPERADLLVFLALTGMRRGEACGLQWGDVELEIGRLTVRRSVLDVGELVERQPKTGRVRRIALGDLGTQVLTERRRFVEERATLVGAEISDDAFVWSDVEDGLAPLRPGTVTQFFSRLVVQCDLVTRDGSRRSAKYSLHSLRHFAATQLVAANVDVRTVSKRTGHVDATTVLRIYAHALESRDLEAANILGRIISDGSSGSEVA